MADADETKRQARLKELGKESEAVARLRRELTEAEARRDALLLSLLAPGSPVAAIAAPEKRPLVVLTPFEVFIERVRALGREFGRKDAVKASDLAERTVSRHLADAVGQKILRRTARGRYVFPPREPRSE